MQTPALHDMDWERVRGREEGEVGIKEAHVDVGQGVARVRARAASRGVGEDAGLATVGVQAIAVLLSGAAVDDLAQAARALGLARASKDLPAVEVAAAAVRVRAQEVRLAAS